MPAPRKRATQPRSNAAARVPATSGSATVGAAADVEPWPPPAGISDEATEAWAAIFTEPQAHGFTRADRVILERYIRAYDAWLIAMAAVEVNPLGIGSQGQEVANPLMNWVASREAEMEKCEKQLGIGLRNRTDLGVSVAQAKLTAAQLNEMTAGGANGGQTKQPRKAPAKGTRKKAGEPARREVVEADVLAEFEHA